MKKFLVAMGLVAFAVVGCDNSSSASAGANDEPGVESSSSSGKVTEPAEVTSSSCEKAKSSSSGVTLGSEYDESTNKLKDLRDGKIYKTVTIGNQVWMAENLNYYDSTNLSVKAKSWCYNDSAYYCEKYGRLYTWAAAVDSVKLYRDESIDCGYGRACVLSDTVYGICPQGWHLPSNTEWESLFSAVGDQSTAAKMLRTTSGWVDGGNGTDSVGFSALPAGFMTNLDCNGRVGNVGCFGGDGYAAFFWSATENSVYEAYYFELYYFLEGASGHYISKNYAYSVRCVRD